MRVNTRHMNSTKGTSSAHHRHQGMPLSWSSCTVTLTWHAGKHKAHKLYKRDIITPSSSPEDAPLVECMSLVFTRVPAESYSGQFRSLLLCSCGQFRSLLLCACDVFQVLTLSLPWCHLKMADESVKFENRSAFFFSFSH